MSSVVGVKLRLTQAMLLRYLAWALLPLLAVIELIAQFFFASCAPNLEQWQALRPTIAELRKQDEFVVIAPYWAEPNARYAFGDVLMPLRDVARPDERGYSRAIEVSILGERTPELTAWRVVSERAQGKFVVRILENPHPEPAQFDFVDQLGPEHAQAQAKQGGSYQDCPWNDHAEVTNGALDDGHPTFPGQRFACRGPEWNFVGVTVLEDQRYRPRRCIWAQPSNGGGTLVRYGAVPLGRVIRGHTALPYWVERWGKGKPITMVVRVGETTVGEVVHKDAEGWKQFELSTEAFAGRTLAVEFEVKTASGPQRQFCFQAEVP
jgi:hypothetical protein